MIGSEGVSPTEQREGLHKERGTPDRNGERFERKDAGVGLICKVHDTAISRREGGIVEGTLGPRLCSKESKRKILQVDNEIRVGDGQN